MTPASSSEGTLVLRLYVAGNSPNSVQALANLRALTRAHLPPNHRIEIVDALEEPLRLLREGVLVTPTLRRIAPLPSLEVVGDLSDREQVLRALELHRAE